MAASAMHVEPNLTCSYIPLQYSVVQAAKGPVKLPPDSINIKSIESMEEFENYEILSIRDAGLYFQKGQYIAKAWMLDNEEWTFYAARLNVLTKDGPYAYFEADKMEVVQTDLSLENYGELWVFLKKKHAVLMAEEAAAVEKEAAKRIREEKKRAREAEAAVARANRPKREGRRASSRAAATYAEKNSEDDEDGSNE